MPDFEDRDVLSIQEVSDAIGALSPAEKSRLAKIAMIYVGQQPWKYPEEDYLELVDEAISRMRSGKRKCPRFLNIVPALRETMRSIVSQENREWRREHEPALVRIRTVDGENVSEEVEYRSQHANPEELLLAYEEWDETILIFQDNPSAQRLIIGMKSGLEGNALLEWSGLPKTKYNSAMTAIRRRREKLRHIWNR
ncbi:MAG: hypothetical protein Q8M24_25035 [Pseudolabrys sp.]|nr:hypothetical protein [Pseudolabrys sp.]MDP2298716.1 hypothetical protein [Pseudolabrys sp.]